MNEQTKTGPAISRYRLQMAARAVLLVLVPAVLYEATLPGSDYPPAIPHLDKLIHFFAYGTIAWLCRFAWHTPGRADSIRRLLAIVVFVGGLGMVAEWIQAYTPWRDAGWQDVIANLAGVFAFLRLYPYIHHSN